MIDQAMAELVPLVGVRGGRRGRRRVGIAVTAKAQAPAGASSPATGAVGDGTRRTAPGAQPPRARGTRHRPRCTPSSWTRWDIIKLLDPVKWTIDIYSRYVPGWMLARAENARLAEALLADTAAKQGPPPAHSPRRPRLAQSKSSSSPRASATRACSPRIRTSRASCLLGTPASDRRRAYAIRARCMPIIA